MDGWREGGGEAGGEPVCDGGGGVDFFGFWDEGTVV